LISNIQLEKRKRLFLNAFLLLVLCCAFVLSFIPCFAQDLEGTEADVGLSAESTPDSKDIDIPKLTLKAAVGKPLIDGHLNETFWDQAEAFDLNIELYPERLAPAVIETEAFVAATKTHLYVAFRADDSNIELLRSALREHDASKDDDYVSIIIDPTGTMAKKYEFRVNPHGSLSDVMQDTISDRYIYDWDTKWEGAAQITDTGYTVEIAIPASSLRMPNHDTAADAHGAVILKRSYPRSVDRVLATFFIFNRGTSETGEKADILSATDSEKPEEKETYEPPDNLKINTHYIYHLDEKRSIGEDFDQKEERDVHSVGLDLEYNFSTSKTLTATINPNFTEVESDIARQSINNPFTIFKPEKRVFFKSVTEYYRSLIPVVYTRNILQPEVGFSYISDDATNSFGAFAVNDKETEVIVPDNLGSDKVELLEKSYAASFRFRRSKGSQTSGILGTYRGGNDYSGDDYHNATIGYDGLYDFGPDDKLRYHILYSDTEYPKDFAEDLCEEDGCTDEPPPEECPLGDCPTNSQVLRADYDKRLNGTALQVRYKHDGPKGLYWLGYEQSSPDFRADLGSLRRVDIRSLNLAYGKKWYLKALRSDKGKSRIRSYATGKYVRSFEYNDLLEQAIGFWGEFRGSQQSVVRLGWRFGERAVNRINQASLETGDNAPLFDESYAQWYFETAPWGNWKLNLDGRFGKIADAENMVAGDMLEIKPKLTFRYGPVEFIPSAIFRDYEVDDERLYLERFLSFSVNYRNSRTLSHRLLYLDDLTERDVERWRGDETAKEVERTYEYTLTYQPAKSWKILTGFKLEYDYNSDIDDGDITNQQIYFKIEKNFN
jgi:hypothetical protein